MGKLINLIGRHFTRLLVVKRVANSKAGQTRWLCRCDCGNYTIVQGGHLKSGSIRSCGCLCREQGRINGQLSRIHGMSRTPEYQVWLNMKSRCYNLKNIAYKYYGGRGITVCNEWLNSFKAFFNDTGKKPGPKHTLERVNNGSNYEPGNCKWATQKEQCGNRRLSSRCKEFKAMSPIGRVYISKNQSEFAGQFNLNNRLINQCLLNRHKTHKGWTFEYI